MFKSLGNPHYDDVKIDSSAIADLELHNEDQESPEKLPLDGTDLDDEIEEGFDTCFIPENLTANLLANKSNVTKIMNDTMTLAPGENKVPTNWLENTDFEAKAFPCYFPSGRNTLSEDRPVKLTTQQYFTQRLMNTDCRFSSDTTYLCAAQQRVERELLEKKCDLFFKKGKIEMQSSGVCSVTQSDVMTVFHSNCEEQANTGGWQDQTFWRK